MEKILHRVNTPALLKSLDPRWGAEIDIRSENRSLILAHDAHQPGPSLNDFLETYSRTHRDHLLIFNPKEDGLENGILALARQHRIERFFFLDLAFPTLIRLCTREQERRVAIRVSEFEPVEAAEKLSGLVEWVWLDCFRGEAPSMETVSRLKKNFKVCLVSPELQGYPQDRISLFTPLAAAADAVCSKSPSDWP